MSILIGLACGAGVCGFGMWAFLRGQRSMLEIRSGGLPEEIRGPVSLAQEAAGRRGEPDFDSQMRALFADGAPRRGNVEGD